jgi:hypothetical protein
LTNDNSTQYTFSSSEGGTISIGGSCSTDNNTAVADNMTVSFAALADGTYSDCTITVTDSAGNTQTISVNTFTIDTVKPVLAQVIAVTTPTNDNTSSYTFSSTEVGNITYGVCSGSPDNASADNNTITFDALADGNYSDCKISVTDNASNTSDNLSVSSFTIDTVKPVLGQVTAVTSPTNATPGYAFSSDEAGTISYGGCSPGGTSAINGTNSISFGTLSEGSHSCTITVTDSAGNASSALSVNTFVVDTTAPTVDNVSSSTADGSYSLFDNVSIQVTFSEAVNVSGTPILLLLTGDRSDNSTNDNISYSSGNGTNTLTFTYDISSDDNSTDLDYYDTNSLSGGSITDLVGNSGVLDLPSPGSSGSLGANKAIVVTDLWQQHAYIKSSNNFISDEDSNTIQHFGSAVAISGNTIAVSAPLDKSSSTTIINGTTAASEDTSSSHGAVYIYKYDGTNWSQQAYIKPPVVNNFKFGYSIDLHNDTLVVGSIYEDSNQDTITNGSTASSDTSNSQSGAVWVFVRNGNNWSQQAYIKASNSEAGDEFGYSVAVSGDIIAVGAPKESSNQIIITNGSTSSSNNSAYASGAVYVYKRTNGNWAQQAYIKTSTQNWGVSNLWFGASVDLSNSILVVGAPFSASNNNDASLFLFSSNIEEEWGQNARLQASNNSNENLQLGTTVSISQSGTYIVSSTGLSWDADRVRVFHNPDGSDPWSLQASISPTNNNIYTTNDRFGESVSISSDGGYIVIGSPFEDSNQSTITQGSSANSDNSLENSGAAYVYKRSGTTWTQDAYIKAANAKSGNSRDAEFGSSVAIGTDKTIIVGAYAEGQSGRGVTNSNTISGWCAWCSGYSGAAYVYKYD